MDTKFVTYLVYLLISVGLTVWVAQTLYRSGRYFLLHALHDERLADSLNHLLIVGFYLLSLGYVTIQLRIGGAVGNATSALESISTKIGLVLLVLGVIHLANIFVLNRYRRHTEEAERMAERPAYPAPDPRQWYPPAPRPAQQPGTPQPPQPPQPPR